ncbi:MAG: cysteine desulfurase [Candidatus Bipolaricaulaceae bacterium]
MIDLERVRADFPILSATGSGRQLVYLDSGATSQRPRQVMEAVARLYGEANANVHRGIYALSARATDLYEEAREKTAAFIGARPDEVVFTSGTTAALNLAAFSLAEGRLAAGDQVVATVMEHHANLVPWQRAAARTGAQLVTVGITADGRLDLEELRTHISPRTRVVALAHVSNVLGTINPVREVARLAHRVGAAVVVDAAQSVPHMPVSVADLEVDLLAFSGHKMLGPTGIGVLWGRRELLAELPPFLTGGEMIEEVWLDRATWADPPAKFEAGTPPFAQAVGLGAAIDYLQAVGMEQVRAHDMELTARALDGLLARPYVAVYGPRDPRDRGGVVAFTVAGVHPHDVATALDQEGIAIRAGHHCAQPLHRLLEVPATCRVSFYLYNTPQEVGAFLAALDRAREAFG